jgi:UDP-N-acetylmuramate--alanine ligase
MTIALDGHHHVHFVGIGGIGMSALARLLLARGIRVTGSDRSSDEQVIALREAGAEIATGHDARNVAGADLVVISSAVAPDNPEVRAAESASVSVIKRAELLAAVMNPARGIAVAGTHGKTTTSALIGHVLTEAGLDPTVLIGGISSNLGSNARVGAGELVVVEADEYDASFLRLRPRLAVITNVEPDHLDYYRSLERLHAAFRRFAVQVVDALVICADDPVLPDLVAGAQARVVEYGLERGEWRAGGIQENGDRTRFTASHGDQAVQYETSLAGDHNVRNCLAAIAVAHVVGIGHETAVRAVASFAGVGRRFERVGEAGGVLILDDYAHHPTEIRVNLAAARARFGRPLRVVFQPHTYSRTRALLDDFAAAFGDAATIYVMDIYAAREIDTLGISSRDLADAMSACHPGVRLTPTAGEAVGAVVRDARAGDVVITMGAGDVYRLGPEIVGRLAVS